MGAELSCINGISCLVSQFKFISSLEVQLQHRLMARSLTTYTVFFSVEELAETFRRVKISDSFPAILRFTIYFVSNKARTCCHHKTSEGGPVAGVQITHNIQGGRKAR